MGGTISWLIIPKQFNPDISAPTYSILMTAPGYSSKQIYDYVTKPTENILSDMEGLDTIYSTTARDYSVLTVAFKAGTDTETAVTRLTNKIMTKIYTKPTWVSEPIIRSVDSNDIPIYAFALTTKSWSTEDSDTQKIELKKAAKDLMERIQNVEWVSALYLVGGEDDNINIILDLTKLEAKNTDLMQVYKAIKESNVRFPGGKFTQNGVNNEIVIDGNLNDISKVQNIVVNYVNGSSVLLSDVATVYGGVSEKKYETLYSESWVAKNSVFVAIAKKKWTNAVVVVDALKEELRTLGKEIWNSYEIKEIQNEWAVAEHSTSNLFHELVNTVIILFFILLFFLGFKDALSSAISVPLVLAITFIVAYVTGDNINKITLFALILALGMLVDDSIIVVENITRHMNMRDPKKETVLDTILKAVDEIGFAALFSTITKVVAFLGLFFVQGMLGQYTWPIPKYLIISLVTSIFVAFAINPYVSYLFETHREKKWKGGKWHGHSEWRIIIWYRKTMTSIMNSSKKQKWMKISFWGILLLLFILPQLEVVKMRLLPKSDQNQMYVWIDMPRNTPIETSLDIAKWLDNYLGSYTATGNLDVVRKKEDTHIISNISYSVGIAPPMDFSTATRGGPMRGNENQISLRINLLPADLRDATSEDFTLALRPILTEYLVKYPGAKLRLLEDPPGPPVKSTFYLKVSGKAWESIQEVENLTTWLSGKVAPILAAQKVLDVYTTPESYQNKYTIELNYEMMTRLWVGTEQAVKTIYSIFNSNELGVFNDPNSKEPKNLILKVSEDEKNTASVLDKITFTSVNGKKILLSEIAKISIDKNDTPIENDDRLPTASIYGEMWDNSVMYPVVNIIKRFLSSDFWEGKYEVLSWNPYEFSIRDITNGKEFRLRFAGEWEMTMDSFRDLALALWSTLTFLFFLVAANFRSFRMGWVIMLSFLLGFFGILPGFAILYLTKNIYMSATSLIWVITLSGIVIGNGIIFFDYFVQLVREGMKPKEALVEAGATRMTPIMLTSATAILWAVMIAWDPVWSWLAWSLIWWLSASATLMLFVVPVFALGAWEKGKVQ